jgi:flagellar hook-basal body complex protein FliE
MITSPSALYATVARLSETASPSTGPAGPATGPGGSDAKAFATTLADAAKNAVGTVQAGEQAAMQGLAGTMDTHQVVAAMTRAELTIQATIAVRDKMVQAYQELMRMPV